MEGLEDIIELFKQEVSDRLSRVEEELVKNSGKDVELIYREFHTIKGTSQMLGFENYAKAAHMVEDVVKPLWKASASLPSEFIPRLLSVIDVLRKKVGEDLSSGDMEKIDSVLKGENLERSDEVGLEIVSEIDKKLLEKVVDESEDVLFLIYRRYSDDNELSRKVGFLSDSLRELYWQLETVSLQKVIKGFDRLVYDEASRGGKIVRFESDVKGIRVKKEIASSVRDALVHIVKNAVVHGIEKPKERKKLGKPREGVVKISGKASGKRIIIEVSDDGGGIDFEKIREKLEKLGKEVPSNEKGLLSVIFEPFFSTKDMADIGGGRGVGLSSVKTFIESIGGSISIRTKKGKGTTFVIEVPSERVWERVMVVKSKGALYALKISDVEKVEAGLDGEFSGPVSAVLRNGKVYRFDSKVLEDELAVMENPFPSLENVVFWVDFLGIPVPVLR